jgi:hypothetical protein
MAQSQVSTKVAIAAALQAAEVSVTKIKVALAAATREGVPKATSAKLTKALRAAESSVSELREMQSLPQPAKTPAPKTTATATATATANSASMPTEQGPIQVKQPGPLAGIRDPNRFGWNS